MSTPAWHYREAERLAAAALEAHGRAQDHAHRETDEPMGREQAALADAWIRHEFETAGCLNDAALVHATLANAGAQIEVYDAAGDVGDTLVVQPWPADPECGDLPRPGSEWGRAFYGDRHLEPPAES